MKSRDAHGTNERQTMTIEEQNRQKLREATKDIELSADEERTLNWLAGWDAYTIDNVVSVISKARRSERGKHGKGTKTA